MASWAMVAELAATVDQPSIVGGIMSEAAGASTQCSK
jgi:hypothetical protein